MKSVSFVIELKDKVSAMMKKITGAFNDLQTDVDKTQTKMQQFQSALGKLDMPNFNAILQVAERLGSQFASAAETGMSFGQSMADLSSIPGRGTKIPHATKQLSLGAATTEPRCHN